MLYQVISLGETYYALKDTETNRIVPGFYSANRERIEHVARVMNARQAKRGAAGAEGVLTEEEREN